MNADWTLLLYTQWYIKKAVLKADADWYTMVNDIGIKQLLLTAHERSIYTIFIVSRAGSIFWGFIGSKRLLSLRPCSIYLLTFTDAKRRKPAWDIFLLFLSLVLHLSNLANNSPVPSFLLISHFRNPASSAHFSPKWVLPKFLHRIYQIFLAGFYGFQEFFLSVLL